RRRGAARDRRRVEAGDGAGDGAVRLRLPVDARPSALGRAVRLDRLWLSDFRNYEAAELAPSPSGLTVIHGANGEGKTNLLEAVGYLATLSSFRGAPAEALVRVGADSAVVRAEGEREGRSLLIEASL